MSASKWKPYPKYKSSKNPVGTLPTSWDEIRFGMLFETQKGKIPSEIHSEPIPDSIPYLSMEYLREGTMSQYVIPEQGSIIIENDDLMILWDGSNAGEISKSKYGILSSTAAKISPKNDVCRDFDFFSLKSLESIIKSGNTGMGIPHVGGDFLKKLRLPRPSLNERQKIVKFLNHRTEAINSAITRSNQKLLLLEEKRSALITQAVTKGLNPDVPMKDSRIEWIGQIPQHWKTKKVKYLFHLVNEPSIASHGKELLSVYTAIGVRPRKSLEQKGNKATSTDGYWLVQKEDLVVNKLLAWMGAIGRSEYDGVTSPAYDILRPLGNTVTEYYHFLFRCGICLPEFKKRSRGIMEMRLRLYFEELGSIEVPCPPPKEQQEIADYIRNLDDTQIDLETGINKQIEKLKEFQTALISAAVTGKIDLRGQA